MRFYDAADQIQKEYIREGEDGIAQGLVMLNAQTKTLLQK